MTLDGVWVDFIHSNVRNNDFNHLLYAIIRNIVCQSLIYVLDLITYMANGKED